MFDPDVYGLLFLDKKGKQAESSGSSPGEGGSRGRVTPIEREEDFANYK